MKITLRNAFHNTEANVIPKNGRVPWSALRRALNKLCMQNDCKCSVDYPKGWVVDYDDNCWPFLREETQ